MYYYMYMYMYMYTLNDKLSCYQLNPVTFVPYISYFCAIHINTSVPYMFMFIFHIFDIWFHLISFIDFTGRKTNKYKMTLNWGKNLKAVTKQKQKVAPL